MTITRTETWLDQWLNRDSYPERPVRYRHIDDIDKMVPGGLTEALKTIRARGWCAVMSGRHVVVFKSKKIKLLTESIEITR